MPDALDAAAGEPRTHAELLAAFDRVSAAVRERWRALDPAVFVSPIGEHWSPAQNAAHLALSDRAVARGLSAPAAVLQQRFGAPERPSRTFAAIRKIMDSVPAAAAPPPFHPADARPADASDATWRDAVLAEAETAARAYRDALAALDESALDASLMPHPLFGPLTLREFAIVNVLHHVRHARNVARRLPGAD